MSNSDRGRSGYDISCIHYSTLSLSIRMCMSGSHWGNLRKVTLNGNLEVFFSFSFDPDPKVRNTFWTLTLGGAFTAMPVWTVSQTAVQRFLAIRTFKDAKR